MGFEPDDVWEVHTLTIKNCSLEDASEFQLEASNRVGTSKLDVKLVVVTEEPK